MKSKEEQQLHARVEQVRERQQGLAAELRVVDEAVETLAPQRLQYKMLDQACASLVKLGELGASPLFWGERIEPGRPAELLRGARGRLLTFQAQQDKLEQKRQTLLAQIRGEEQSLEVLGEDLYDLREEQERRKLEWIVEREISPVPPRIQRMAWTRGGEDDRRFRKSLALSLLAGLFLGALFPMIDLPLPKRFVPDEMPRRLAQLVRKEQAKPLPPPPLVEETPTEQTPQEQPEEQPQERPKPAEQSPETPTIAEAQPKPSEQPNHVPPGPAARAKKKVEKAGILAFRDKFASLAKDKTAPRLGAQARLHDADEASRPSSTTRSMLTSNEPGSSGGINLASLSRNVGGAGDGGAGGGGIHGVQVGEATSSIASIGGGGDRPLASGGPGPSRTDEEIQIVFDRYKASFYRLYNRELRNDPTLQGQMVLRLTIEPDGSVSTCKLQSTDMDAPNLADQVVERVRSMNFGAKEGVKALTIVYPMDFLPAA